MSKPRCHLIGTDGNIFALMGRVSKTLKKAGLKEEAKQMCDKVMASGSYDEALTILDEFVEIE